MTEPTKPRTPRKNQVVFTFDGFRMSIWLLWTFIIFMYIAYAQPQQLEVVLYKAGLITFAAWMGYWVDRSLFIKFRVDERNPDLSVSMVRRAIVVGCVILGMTLGL